MLCTIFIMAAAGNDIPNFAADHEDDGKGRHSCPAADARGGDRFFDLGQSVGHRRLQSPHRRRQCCWSFWCWPATISMRSGNSKGKSSRMQMINFMKNLSIAGAMLFIMANGSGPLSLDSSRAGAALRLQSLIGEACWQPAAADDCGLPQWFDQRSWKCSGERMIEQIPSSG